MQLALTTGFMPYGQSVVSLRPSPTYNPAKIGLGYWIGEHRLPNIVGGYGISGLGDEDSDQQAKELYSGLTKGVSIGANTAIAVGGTGGEIAGGIAGALALAGSFPSPAAPFLLAASALVAPIASLFKGCGSTCTQATAYANQFGDMMNNLLNQYLSQPVRYKSTQTACLSVFDSLWAQLVQACSNPALLAAGQRCISDRQAGACVWKASPGGWVQGSDGKYTYKGWGAAGSGSSCWNYFVGFRDPIANDPGVQDDPPSAAVTGALNTLTSDTVGGIPLIVLAGAGLILFGLMSSGGK